jgi:hypothetical protein
MYFQTRQSFKKLNRLTPSAAASTSIKIFPTFAVQPS